ncbi:pirin family protein [Belliella kenyensis]|uniref:Pirin family protein n=1 Tax=Belliella kenyensis TaxID=1472724 RepID=A0ABV8ES92_9BACT|nr:pirin family protein [Belliella kenyensis]MCH7402929.1 pirin family protein [Belliella kenyensis]MDN3602635.1 pirin family protein [Belliella kenyensis]
MSNISLIIEERAANIGNFMVGRLLPFRQKRAVGPFVFIDHMGPVKMSERENMEVLPHPHIGLSTLTFLFDGAIMHRDSIGSEVEIQPGAVNWMTAGSGVVHSERTPERLQDSTKSLHGLQIWVALPKELEETSPSFTHIDANQIPKWQDGDVRFKLIAGEALDKKSPVPVHSKLYFIEIKSQNATKVSIGDKLYGESALYILEGSISSEGNEYGPKQILIAKDAKLCEFDIGEHSTVYIFGGEPFPEERYIDWNFVSSSKERLAKAKEDWVNQKFPKVVGETDFVPYPTFKKS